MDFRFFHAILAIAAVVLPLFLAWGLLLWGERRPPRNQAPHRARDRRDPGGAQKTPHHPNRTTP